MSTPQHDSKTLFEHHARLAAAWEAGHQLADEMHGPENTPSYFTPPYGNELMAKLEALPIGATAEQMAEVVHAHVEKKLP